MDCANLTILDSETGIAECAILKRHGIDKISGPGSNGCLCCDCMKNWASGSPPSSVEENSVLLMISGTAPSPPSLTLSRKVKSAVSAFRRFVSSGGKVLDKSSAESRFWECRKCRELGSAFGRSVCNACGCFLAVKIRLPDEHCPLGKWPGDPPVPSGGCGPCGGGSGATADR